MPSFTMGDVVNRVIHVVSVALLGFLVYIFGLVFYRLTFHPLAKYPGPFLAKITGAYMAYHAWKGDRQLEYYRSHQKYGHYVRMGPNHLSIDTNTALKAIYGFKSNVRKADFYTAFPANKHTFNVHSSIDKTSHARKRRVISHAFSDQAIKSMERYILQNVRDACEAISSTIYNAVGKQLTNKDGWSLHQNMGDWSDWLAFDIMGDLAFGKSFEMSQSPKNRFAAKLVGSAAHRHLICGTYLPIHNFHLDKFLFPAIAAGRAQYMAYSRAQAAERTKLGVDIDRRDFFYYLLNAKDPETGQGFTTNELWGESNLLIIAGSDTTSTAMAGTIYYLIHHPNVLDKVTKEIQNAFPNSVEDIVSGPALTGCTYLRACIDESLRLSPPVGGLLPRLVLPGGIDIDSYHHIPAGIDIGVPHYALHHNPSYFPSPFTYRPERWIVGSAPDITEESVALGQTAFAPFSVGPRGCIGKGLAYVELTVSLARLIAAFEWRLAPDVKDEGGEYKLKDTFTSMKDGPIMQFKLREVKSSV